MVGEKQNDVIVKAKCELLLDEPFLASLLANIQLVNSDEVPLAGTDGKRLLVNPVTLAKLSPAAVKGVLAHELLHCAFRHFIRRGARDQALWNIACDMVINRLLKISGFTLPPGAIIGTDDITAEEEFSRLKASGIQVQGDPVFHGDLVESPDDDDGDKDAQDMDAIWRVATIKAAERARRHGKCPAYVKHVEDAAITKTRWEVYLRQYITDVCRDEPSWKRPSLKYAPILMPGRFNRTRRKVVVAIDSSGSINEELLSKFVKEVYSLATIKAREVHVLVCDAAIHEQYVLRRGTALPKITCTGRGGTDFRPVFDLFVGHRPDVLIYCTDLDGTFPDYIPGYPVIWAVVNNNNNGIAKNVPFGRIINVD